MFFPGVDADRPKQKEINDGLKDWFMTIWTVVLSVFVIVAYPTTISLFGIFVSLLFGISRKIWSVVLSFIAILVSAIGNCFYSYSPFFIDMFNIYPKVILKYWQWVAGSLIAHVVLIIVMIMRVALRSKLSSTRMLMVIFTLRSRG